MSWLIPVHPTKMNLKVCEGVSPSTKCRYFAVDDEKDNRPVCLKLNKEYRQNIDAEIDLFESELQRIKRHARGDDGLPFGDNCPGVEMRQ